MINIFIKNSVRGWGAVITDGMSTKKMSGKNDGTYFSSVLQGLIDILESLPDKSDITIYSDIDTIIETGNKSRNQWRPIRLVRVDQQEDRNYNLWLKITELEQRHTVHWERPKYPSSYFKLAKKLAERARNEITTPGDIENREMIRRLKEKINKKKISE